MMLKLSGITHSFAGGFAPVLKNMSLALQEGEFCVVLGANGSGKSTLMKVVSGEYVPDAGEVSCPGPIVQVTQDIHVGTIPTMTLLENVALGQMRRQKPRFAFYRRYRDSVTTLLKTLGVGLEAYIDQPLASLSGGQRQMVATLMALHAGGRVILLDEHTSALDPCSQHLLMQYTATAIKALGLTAMMVTHKIDDAITYGNRLIMLHHGEIVVDLGAQEKAKLTATRLLALFQQYEAQNLLGGHDDD